ncbi:MAG TPA: carboxypeptidase-like regulatory domain-containing protein [Longimicrobium sp.]|nr:carboxypeptidase-like regulatory domain-containing protein [Longimicrobium sp.]
MRPTLVTASLLALAAPPAGAQIRGSVADPAGAPVPGAAVEAWAGLRQVARATSDAGGSFVLPTVRPGDATGLVVHRIGYRRLAIGLTAADSVVRLRLTPAPANLAGITATAETRGCPNREEPRARAAWEAARAKYPPFGDTAVFHSLARFREGDVPRENVDAFAAGPGTRGWNAAGTVAWPMWRRQIRVGGYAARIRQPLTAKYALWLYVPLEMEFAQHFIDPLFGELHTLSVGASNPDETTIRFCPLASAGRTRPEIEGTLTLAEDGTLLRGTWRYRTPRPTEDAGGELDFLPPEVTAQRLLLPERSLFWRRTTGGRYHVEGRTYQEWRLYPGAEAPPIPADAFAPDSAGP